MRVNIVFGNKEIAEAVKAYLNGTKKIDCRKLYFDKEQTLSSDILSADIWLIEAMHRPRRPEGFQLAKNLVLSGQKVLLLFSYHLPESIQREGSFWTVFHSAIPLSEKINQVLRVAMPCRENFECLESMWPVLAERISTHHRRVR